ncbi:hypothetical protein AV530_010905 [Patagioenas fasciata monilis]|uniref:Uncharacterized protein n=1 Tax=Patagioenas fasciata monilis TaxID=372326 RepID=A0A1V4K9R3_PATFA|nr:hypothetical protein AV530_010905 [Patagioenas fasciata monilis]
MHVLGYTSKKAIISNAKGAHLGQGPLYTAGTYRFTDITDFKKRCIECAREMSGWVRAGVAGAEQGPCNLSGCRVSL